MERDAHFAEGIRSRTKLEGKELDELTMVNLLMKRLQQKDCQQKGWVIENFPQTRSQAIFMAQKGL